MKNAFKWAPGVLLAAAGAIGLILTRENALAEGAPAGSKVLFAVCCIGLLLGIIQAVRVYVPERKTDIRTLTLSALFAALCYIGFAYLRLDIPVGTEKTAFHFGNVFCVLAALFLGGFWGGMSGAVGLTIADLTSAYITSAPKTFLLKFCIGLVAGFAAHRVFHISREQDRKISLPVAVTLSSACGMIFNIVADPVAGYFYKMYVLGIPQQAANLWAKMGAVTTLVNGVIAIIVSSVLYLAVRKPLSRNNILPKL